MQRSADRLRLARKRPGNVASADEHRRSGRRQPLTESPGTGTEQANNRHLESRPPSAYSSRDPCLQGEPAGKPAHDTVLPRIRAHADEYLWPTKDSTGGRGFGHANRHHVDHAIDGETHGQEPAVAGADARAHSDRVRSRCAPLPIGAGSRSRYVEWDRGDDLRAEHEDEFRRGRAAEPAERVYRASGRHPPPGPGFERGEPMAPTALRSRCAIEAQGCHVEPPLRAKALELRPAVEMLTAP